MLLFAHGMPFILHAIVAYMAPLGGWIRTTSLIVDPEHQQSIADALTDNPGPSYGGFSRSFAFR